MPPLTQGIDEPTESRFIHYDPTAEPPLPQPEPPRPTLQHRLAAFGVRWLSKTASYVCAAWAVYILATGQL